MADSCEPASNVATPRVMLWGVSMGDSNSDRINDYLPEGDIAEDLERFGFESTVAELPEFYRKMHDYVLAKLGHPSVRVELTTYQIKLCIDEAIARLEYQAPYWMTNFATFEAVPGCSVYKIPRYILRNLTYVYNKKTFLGGTASTENFEFDFMFHYVQNNSFFRDFSVGEFYLVQSHFETMRKVLSRDGGWDIINGQYLNITPRPNNRDGIILEYRAIDSKTLPPFYLSWCQRYALAEAMITLSVAIRGKFETMPGPGGGTKLDYRLLYEEGSRSRDELKEELRDEITEPPAITSY